MQPLKVKSVPQNAPNGPGDCNLVCISHVNASYPADANNCTMTFTYADFITNATTTCNYTVKITIYYMNQLATVRMWIPATWDTNGLFCNWSHGEQFLLGLFNDGRQKLPCVDGKIPKASCFPVSWVDKNLGRISDNCSTGTQKLESTSISDLGDGCTDVRGIGQAYRAIRSWDVWGNTTLEEIRSQSLWFS